MLLCNFEVSEVLADPSIDFIEDAKLYGGLFADFDVPGSLDSPVQSACENGEVASLFFTGYQLIKNLGKSL